MTSPGSTLPAADAPTGDPSGDDGGAEPTGDDRAKAPSRPAPGARRNWPYGLLAVLCYVPMLLTKPGVVSDDTKTYLYLDPASWVKAAPNLWDPNVALGTVTHQNIGYLLPMGPFFWFFSAVHVPIWVAQRLWLGSILFAAAAGVLYLCEVLDLDGPGRVVAAIAYAFTPYVMQYAGRISVILLPFAGLPFLVAFMVQAVRRGGWRYPALFALVVALVSGINASSIIYVGVAPLLWLACAVVVTGESSWRRAWSVFWRTGLLSLLASLWWMAGLSVEGVYGIDILKYTETVEAASSASSASEVIRGLGYWYFYGADRLGLWTTASSDYTNRIGLLAVSYAMPAGAIVAAAVTRWRHRIFFVLLVVVGLLLSVGPHPFYAPSPFGALDKAFMTKTTVGLALRSTDRATPLVVLGLAMLLGSGVSALAARLWRAGVAVAALVGVLVLAGAAPLLAGKSVISQFSQPAVLPSYVQQAASYLNAQDRSTRVYSLPGDNFAAYTFGDTVDPVWPAILDRPYVVHEQFIQGSLPTANVLYALDNPLQQGTMDWSALGPMLRLMSVGNVIVEYDQQYDRYDTPRPDLLEDQLAHTPSGLFHPVAFGTPTPNNPSLAMFDETYFGLPTDLPSPHPLVVYSVADPRPIVRGESLTHALVVDGDAVGVVAAAGLGLLAHNPTIVYAGTLDSDPALAAEVLGPTAQLVVTDSNRKQAYEWNSLSENTGYTETATESPSAFVEDDPGFDLFPAAGSAAETVSELPGVRSVSASAYGTAFTLRSEFRPANAVDGNTATAWETEGTASAPAVSQWWQVVLKRPTSADAITLTQPQTDRNAAWLTNQWITKVTLTFDGSHSLTVPLSAASRGPNGETILFGRRTFSTLRIRIDDTNFSSGGPPPVGSSLVGLAEVGIDHIDTAQIVRVPTDLLAMVGRASIAHRLTFLFTRDRVAPVPPRQDPEVALLRQFTLPTARTFALVGTARLSSEVADDVIDRLVGRVAPPRHVGGRRSLEGLVAAPAEVTSATSSSRMPGDVAATASATLDHDPATAWSPGLGSDAVDGSWLDYTFDRPVTTSRLGLRFVTDAEHSVPTEVTISDATGSRVVRLPALAVTRPAGSTTALTVHFPALRGSSLKVTFTGVAVRDTLSYETSLETALPIAVATVAIPGVVAPALPARLPAVCRSDLLQIDGRPISIEVTGTTSAALAGQGLDVALCGRDAAGVHLAAGTHLLQAADGAVTGLNLDQLALDSAPGGAAMAEPGNGQLTAPAPAPLPPPTVTVTSQSATVVHVAVHGATRPFLLVFGQSVNKGWVASIDGGASLGHSTLVDAFANGWLVDAATLATDAKSGSFDVTIRFVPQREVDLALVVSAATIVLCLVVVAVSVVLARRRRRPGGTVTEASDPPAPLDPVAAPDLGASAPELTSPVAPGRVSRRPLAIAAGVALAGGAALFAAGPTVGIVVALAMLAAMTLRRGRAVPLVGAVVLMAAAVAEIVRHQAVNRYVAGAGWPAHFNLASSMIWAAVLLLAADTGLEAVRARRARRLGFANGPDDGVRRGERDHDRV